MNFTYELIYYFLGACCHWVWNLDVDPKYAILFIHNKKIVESKNNNIFLNNRINDIITETYYSDEKYIEPLVPLIYENIVPSAPLIYEDVVPSAPIIYEEDVWWSRVLFISKKHSLHSKLL